MAIITAGSGTYSAVGAPSLTTWILAIAAGSLTLTGTTTPLVHGYRLTATPGSYTYTGLGIGTRRISAEPAGYILNGQPVTFSVRVNTLAVASGNYTITSGANKIEHAIPYNRGTYGVTGTATTLSRSASPTLGVASGSYGLTGGTTHLQAVLLLGVGDYNTTGQTVNLKKGKGLVVSTRTYSIAPGPAVNLRWFHKFPSTSASYTLTGSIATLRFSGSTHIILAIDQGILTLSGKTSGLYHGRYLSATSGSYTVTGKTVNTLVSNLRSLNPGVYSYTGSTVALRKTWILGTVVTTYSVVGTPAILVVPISTVLNSGVYNLFGRNASLLHIALLTPTSGNYTQVGTDTILRATRLSADSGIYLLTGTINRVISTTTSRWKHNPKRPRDFTVNSDSTSTWDPQPPSPGV